MQGFARAFTVMLFVHSASNIEEKTRHLQEGQGQREDSTAKYKCHWQKLKNERESWEKEENLNSQLKDAYIQLKGAKIACQEATNKG